MLVPSLMAQLRYKDMLCILHGMQNKFLIYLHPLNTLATNLFSKVAPTLSSDASYITALLELKP